MRSRPEAEPLFLRSLNPPEPQFSQSLSPEKSHRGGEGSAEVMADKLKTALTAEVPLEFEFGVEDLVIWVWA